MCEKQLINSQNHVHNFHTVVAMGYVWNSITHLHNTIENYEYRYRGSSVYFEIYLFLSFAFIWQLNRYLLIIFLMQQKLRLEMIGR